LVVEAALVGVIGVVVGALLSAGGALVLVKRTERRKARAAARLIEDELGSATQALQRLTYGEEAMFHNLPEGSDPGYWALVRLSEVPKTTLWKDNMAVLAEVLNQDQWYAVASAYRSLDALRDTAACREKLFPGHPHRGHHALNEWLTKWANEVQAGAVAISRLAGGPPPPSPDPWGEGQRLGLQRAIDDAKAATLEDHAAGSSVETQDEPANRGP
jgi:hypothetical protein